MKFKCEQQVFAKGLQAVAKGISGRNTIYALSGILIKAKDNKLVFTATDNEITLRCEEPDVNIEEEGSLIVPGKYILEITRKLPDDMLIVSTEGYTMFIDYQQSRITVNGMDEEEFPEFPVIDETASGSFSLHRFKKDIKEVSIAASTDETRPLFTGTLLEIEGNKVQITATDTHRLSTKASGWQAEDESINKSVIIPNRILQEIIRLEGEDDARINIAIGQKEICFTYDKYTYVSRLIEGKFPNYHTVIPAESKVRATVEVNVGEMLSVLERAFILSKELVKEHVGRISLELTDYVMLIDARSPEMGHIHEEMKIEKDGDDMKMIFNARHFLDCLRVMDSDTVIMKFTGEQTPFMIQRKDDESYVYLALPLRV